MDGDRRPLALAFTTDMVVTVNPCGFVMLPAYLSFFAGADQERDVARAVGRALIVGPTVTIGFVATFAVLGLMVSQLTSSVYDIAPWVSLVIGGALVLRGISASYPSRALPRVAGSVSAAALHA